MAVMVVNINVVIVYLSQDDISGMLGRKRGTVNVWRSRFKDDPDPFPDPESGNGLVKTVPGWLPVQVPEIVDWCRRHGMEIDVSGARADVSPGIAAAGAAARRRKSGAASGGPDLVERVALVLIAGGFARFRVTPAGTGSVSVVATDPDPAASALLLARYESHLGASGLLAAAGDGALLVSEPSWTSARM